MDADAFRQLTFNGGYQFQNPWYKWGIYGLGARPKKGMKQKSDDTYSFLFEGQYRSPHCLILKKSCQGQEIYMRIAYFLLKLAKSQFLGCK